MIACFAFLILLAGVWASLFYRVTYKIWVPAFAVLLLFCSYFSLLSFLVLVLCWLAWLALSTIMLLGFLRRQILTKPFMHWFAQQQPPLTDAEQAVLEAGGLWWEKMFFQGNPDWQMLSQLPKPALTQEEQAFLDNQTDTLCNMIDDWKIVHIDKDMPQKVWAYIKQEKFLGLVIDKQHGGLGFSALAHSTIVAKVASRSYSAALNIMVPNSLGPAELLKHYGTQEQQDYYLPRLAVGEEIPCFALTAPKSGSDATSIRDSGIVCKAEFDGKMVVGIRLQFDKRYITLAPIATLIGLAFKLYDPDHLLSDEESRGITLALIPSTLKGITQNTRHYPLNLAFMNGPIRGDNVFIPLSMIIGGENNIGKGWTMLMECLSLGRGISLPALSAATTQLCYRMTGAYAQLRDQFHRSIGEFEGVKHVLARMGGFNYICEATRLFTLLAIDQGERPAVASAITKYHLTELARKTVSDAMDIHAGRGIQMGPRNYLGNMHDGMPTSITVEGANILTRNLIIFGQGAMRAHPYVRQEIAVLNDQSEDKKLKRFDRLIVSHVGFALHQCIRAFSYGLTGGLLIRVKKHPAIKTQVQQLTRMTHAFAFVTDVSMALLGAKLKLKESLSARLGDVVSHLYLASSILKFYQDNGNNADEIPFVRWSLQYCLYEISKAFAGFFANLPNRFVAHALRWIIFPWTKHYGMPKDSVSFAVADAMQTDLVLRDRLTSFCYVGKTADDPTGRMEKALISLVNAQPLLQKLDQAVADKTLQRSTSFHAFVQSAIDATILTHEEGELLMEMQALRDDAIAVDEFDIA